MALADPLLSLVFPVGCYVCGGEVDKNSDGVACSTCWAETHIFTGQEMLCEKCGAFFSPAPAPVAVRCHQCDDHFYERAFAVGIYEKALAASIVRLKSAPVVPKRLVSAVREALSRCDAASIDVIIPIPLSKQRSLERSFNQAEVLARMVGDLTRRPVDAASLSRKSHSLIHRAGMDKRARELTVMNTFEVVRPKLIAGKNILLVDDVFTSGSTTSYSARALKKNGSGQVHVFTLARAVMK